MALTVLLAMTAILPSVAVLLGHQPMISLTVLSEIPEVLAACGTFLVGLWTGGRIAPMRSAPVACLHPAVARRMLLLLGLVAVVLMGFLTLMGTMPLLIEALRGGTSSELTIAREVVAKLNPDKLQVRSITFLRDIAAPMLVIGAFTFWRHRILGVRALLASLAIALLALTWTGQKAPVANMAATLLIWTARDGKDLLRILRRWALPAAIPVLMTFVLTQPDVARTSDTLPEYLSRLGNGLASRVFISPLEVTATYFEAARAGEIGWRETIPSYGFIWKPADLTAEAVIGQTYFSAGIDSTLAGSLCFGYAYVIGGLSMCFITGALTIPLLAFSLKIISLARRPEVHLLFSAYITSLVVDGLQGNLLQYLLNTMFLACGLAFIILLIPKTRAKSNESARDAGSTPATNHMPDPSQFC